MGSMPPVLTALEGNGRTVRLLEDYSARVLRRFGCENEYAVGTITVPAGFRTDFASVPRALWSILPPWGKYSPAAVVHDWLYYCGMYPRVVADEIFLFLMERVGVSWWKRRIMYRAVRTFGGVAWRKHRKGRGPHGETM